MTALCLSLAPVSRQRATRRTHIRSASLPLLLLASPRLPQPLLLLAVESQPLKVRRSRAPLLGRQRVHPPRRRLGEAVAVRDVRLDVEDLRGGRRGRRLRIGTRAASPRSARTGVPSRRSTPRTRSVRCWTESRRTEDSPSGVGRSGERVARTPRRPPRGGDTTGRQPRERCSRVMSQMRSKPCRWARRRETSATGPSSQAVWRRWEGAKGGAVEELVRCIAVAIFAQRSRTQVLGQLSCQTRSPARLDDAVRAVDRVPKLLGRRGQRGNEG